MAAKKTHRIKSMQLNERQREGKWTEQTESRHGEQLNTCGMMRKEAMKQNKLKEK
jgi:hypothetical protein